MDWQAWFALAVTVTTIILLVFSKIRTSVVLMGSLTTLLVSGVLTGPEAFSGFSNPGVITIGALFVVAAGMYSSGAIDMLTSRILGYTSSTRTAIMRIVRPVFLLSGFLNNTPVVATMIPAIHAWSNRISIAPSKLMIPLSYASIFGGMLTMIGTSTNLVVNGQYQALTGSEGFGMFDITLIGLPVALVCITFMWLTFPKLLPDRSDKSAFSDLREFTLEVAVAMNGPLVGKTIEQAGLRNLQRIYLIEIERRGTVLTAVNPTEKLLGGDRLVFAGDTAAISDLLRINGIVPAPAGEEEALMTPNTGRALVEAVVSPHCSVIGSAIRDTRFRDRYGAAILAVARHGQRLKGNLGGIQLKAGDTLLLEARSDFVNRQKHSKEFLLVNDLETESPHHEKALFA
ncbi:MAG: SLC13 family permease, partial [Pseudomonadota bacterium]|nr:SLC13 family permease [Pseudomonadota bacterium]